MAQTGDAQDRRRGAAGIAMPAGPGAVIGDGRGVRASLAAGFDRIGVAWRALIAVEAAPARLLPWIAVAFGIGIVLYFSADREPMLAPSLALAAGVGIWAVMMRARARVFAVAVLLAAVMAGFASATLRAALVEHPVLTRASAVVDLRGVVERREIREKSDRFVLRLTEPASVDGAVLAVERLRLTARKGAAPAVGEAVMLRARLAPPPQPARPGSYDFARDLYFQGIGATGFVLGAIRLDDPSAQPPNLALRYAAVIASSRDAVDARIAQVMTGDARVIATALLTGRRDAISAPVNDAMFVSGLGHVLSISGYHMAIVAGVVFFVLRALLALGTRSSGRPVKAWAATAALLAATAYLLLSGAEVATQRSYLMTAVVLIAVLLDRRAITFRTLALAALLVMALAPEAVVHPSFQMSFAATLGLVALADRDWPQRFAAGLGRTRLAHWGLREIVLLVLASLVAGLATTPYAAFHFHRIAPYGIIANVAAMPVVSGFVMPMGLLGLLAMPFGLDGMFWRMMEIGIGWMVWVAHITASLPGAYGRVTAFGPGPLALMTAGLIVLCLLKSSLRYGGLVLIALGIAGAMSAVQPDLIVAGDLRAAAVRGADGRLRVMRDGRGAFATREWLAADGDGRAAAENSEGITCDGSGCIARDSAGAMIALVKAPQALAEDCMRVAVMVTRFVPPAGCAAQIIDDAVIAGGGALAFRRIASRGTVGVVRDPAGIAENGRRRENPGDKAGMSADTPAPTASPHYYQPIAVTRPRDQDRPWARRMGPPPSSDRDSERRAGVMTEPAPTQRELTRDRFDRSARGDGQDRFRDVGGASRNGDSDTAWKNPSSRHSMARDRVDATPLSMDDEEQP